MSETVIGREELAGGPRLRRTGEELLNAERARLNEEARALYDEWVRRPALELFEELYRERTRPSAAPRAVN